MVFNFDFGDIKVVLGIIAGVIAFLAYIVYIISIFRGGSKPNRATWWIWSFMGLVIGISYYASGAVNTIWVPFVEFIGPFSIALLSIKYGEGGLNNKTDLICLFGAIFSIILWVIFNNPVVALVTNLLIDSFAIVPTIKKSYLRPEGEDFWAWFGTGVADSLNMFAVERFTFAILLYPIYMLVSDLIIIFILLLRKKGIMKDISFLTKHN
ncbi:hypothetical protein A2738_02580 [Candidatus Nomurabacteria bacterium RIFCSPHIGHO2_01_FULL_42_15]|uniref:Uncharacterized protein n=1 Tax=Candidatus Nomurabacteria bacterium RIFCSPHIGHO2_01_FULL_42_15 TaxID=1801742 RepID=A0A1F6VEH9_9BACT|nr:MAG: hypothetical protein A2738_02580 [Candidatus Nomurabacteria bacterium RIFCSPHIGHO2_01_FULL_42_15]OGI92759.1 MAG: hypothetical protein A3A99_02645 [Candidatus Nomurabacteria bacterium RIFCSPLOWO2_01_FULL_41_18]